VRLGPGLVEARPGTGHGNVWTRVIAEFAASDEVKILTRGRPDVWLASGHAEPVGRDRPVVVQVHEIGWHDPELRAFLHPDFADALEPATRAAVGAAARVITPSQAARDQVMSAYGVAGDLVHAVPHGVDTTVFRPGVEGGRAAIGAPYVLFVGVLHPRKNYAALREAVAGLAKQGLPHVLAIVGAPAADPRPEFEQEAVSELPGVPGRVVRVRAPSDAELAALMAGADAFCLPSFFEGFGLPALEAMACGAPVVVSNRGALPEVVGDAGVVVEPTADAVEEALHRVITEPGLADRLRRAGVERAGRFSWPRTAAGWLEALRAAA
jgi:glycosyltransferase involved in cell wall biosynthesis